MIVLHEYRTGVQFALWPNDIRKLVQGDGFTVVVYTEPDQLPPQVVQVPGQGAKQVQPPVQVMLVTAEVVESVEEIQQQIVRVRAAERGTRPHSSVSMLVSRAALIATETRDATTKPFGNGPRVEVER